MIKSFKCKEIERIWDGEVSRKFPPDIRKRIITKLAMLNRSKKIDDLRIPPANHLESLLGNRKGQHSIRINDKYRLCFIWQDNDVFEVEIVDYH